MKKVITTALFLFIAGSIIFWVAKNGNKTSAAQTVKKKSESIEKNEKTATLPYCILDNANCDLPQSHHINIYYFHTTARCITCHKIENYTKESIKNNFRSELKSGSIVFSLKNIQKQENEHFVKDFKLYTKSVVLEEVSNSKQIKWKNLDKVWELVGEKEKFELYIKNEVEGFMK